MSLKTRAKMLNDGQDNAGQSENWLIATTNAPIKIEVDDLNSFYGERHVLHHVSVAIPESAQTRPACFGMDTSPTLTKVPEGKEGKALCVSSQ